MDVYSPFLRSPCEKNSHYFMQNPLDKHKQISNNTTF